MDDNPNAVTATIVGAVLGGLAGYMLFTRQGRMLRHQLERTIEDAAHEVRSLRGTMIRVSSVASEGWQLLKEVVGEDSSSSLPPLHPHHQTTPF